MQKEEVVIFSDFITVDKLLKFAGVVDSGGQAFQLVLEGFVKLNDMPVKEKRKKIFPGDKINIANQIELTIKKDENL